MLPLESYKKKIDSEIGKFFERKLENKSKTEVKFVTALKDFTLRKGKRLRPVLMIVGYLLNGKINDDIIKASISLELIQSYLLIHDDIIDQSTLRRGEPTFHNLFNYSEPINKSIAVVVADLANAYSREILTGANFEPERLISAIRILDKTIEKTGMGELDDIVFPLTNGISEREVTRMAMLKSGEYTVNGPIKMGAALSGFSFIDAIDRYGTPLGIAFQIKDDILGLFGNESEIGKPVDSDVREGKMTHLIVYAVEGTSQSDRKFINKMLGNQEITTEQFEKFRQIVKQSGALDRALRLVNYYKKRAVSAIPNITNDKEMKETLTAIAEQVVAREN